MFAQNSVGATPPPPGRRFSAAHYYGQASVPQITEDELEAAMENFAEHDEQSNKTWTRIVVEKYLCNVSSKQCARNFWGRERTKTRETNKNEPHVSLSHPCLQQFSWYNPRMGMKNAPSLSKAYAYYEHVTLPRHFIGQQTADHVMRRAEPGETEPTELYSPFLTPRSNFIEWGIGMDLYFSTLRIMSGVLLVAGLIHLPLLIFYRSDDYSPDGDADLGFSLLGSAICETLEWVVCSDCRRDDWDSSDEQKGRFGTAVNDDGEQVTLIQRYACDMGQLAQGMVNWGTLVFLLVVYIFMSLYLHARSIRFDEDK
jgi:hypothetical protein